MHTAEDLESRRLKLLKLSATFTEESFLGRIKGIVVQSHGATLVQCLFQRYVLTVGVALHQFKEKMALSEP